MHKSKLGKMNSGTRRVGKRAAEEDVDRPPFKIKRQRQDDAASRMRDHIDLGGSSSMTDSQGMSTSSQLDPFSSIIFEEEDLVLPFETPWNDGDSVQPIRYLRDYRIVQLKSQEEFCISSIQHTSLEFEEQEELPHFLGFVRYKPGDSHEREERIARNHELLVLSSKIWRAWWDRDPDTSEPYVLRFLSQRHQAELPLEAIGCKHNSQLILWKSLMSAIKTTTTIRQC